MPRLDDYLALATERPWIWGGLNGGLDCCFFAGDWITLRSGRDPLALYRGTYDSALGAMRLIAARGGLAAMVDREMTRCGIVRAAAADDGDVGLIVQPGSGPDAVAGATLVIRCGPWWCGRARDGLAYLDEPAKAIWSVPACEHGRLARSAA